VTVLLLIALFEYFDFASPLAKCEKGEGLHTSTIVIANVIYAEFVVANQ